MDSCGDDEIDLSKYKIITVSKVGFQSASSPKPSEEVSTEKDHENVTPPLSDSDPIESLSDQVGVEYELITDSNGDGEWVPKQIKLTATPAVRMSSVYTDPVTDDMYAESVKKCDIEDGHIHDHYVEMFGDDKKDELIVVEGPDTNVQRNDGSALYWSDLGADVICVFTSLCKYRFFNR